MASSRDIDRELWGQMNKGLITQEEAHRLFMDGLATAPTKPSGKPMVTREQYDRAREVLDALPAGVYLKCGRCQKWWRDPTIHFAPDNFYCEGCA